MPLRSVFGIMKLERCRISDSFEWRTTGLRSYVDFWIQVGQWSLVLSYLAQTIPLSLIPYTKRFCYRHTKLTVHLRSFSALYSFYTTRFLTFSFFRFKSQINKRIHWNAAGGLTFGIRFNKERYLKKYSNINSQLTPQSRTFKGAQKAL